MPVPDQVRDDRGACPAPRCGGIQKPLKRLDSGLPDQVRYRLGRNDETTSRPYFWMDTNSHPERGYTHGPIDIR